MATIKTHSVMQLVMITLLFLASCSSRAIMTYDQYDTISTGTKVSTLIQQYGHPYAIHSKGEGQEEYEYIERIDNGETLMAENHYFFLIQGNEVVGKSMKREGPPPYDLIYQPEPNYPGYP